MPTLTNTPGKPPAGRPANRLPHAPEQRSRGREILIGLAGAIGLLLLIVGIPAALCVFVGYPLPRTAPSHAWLTTTVTATLIIKILACVLWVVWAHFVVCIIAEWRSVRRGKMPSVVPLGGGSQLLARRLVASALLLAGAAVLVPSAAAVVSAPSSFPAPTTAYTATLAVSTTPTTNAASSFVDHSSGASTAAAAPTKYYTVTPPEGRHHDSLWDIAQRTLGDPLRYKEIYALNQDRPQPDGRTLHDANLIRPGWQLILPADASGPGVYESSSVAAPTPITPPSAPAHTPADQMSTDTPPSAPVVTPPAPQAASLTQTLADHRGSSTLGGGLMVAGVVVALSSRRGPYVAADTDEQGLSGAGNPELAELLDRALRSLAQARHAQVRPLPALAIAWVSLEKIVLHFAGGDLDVPPTPWRVGDDARSWILDPAELQGPADAPAPYPGLVNVGTAHGFEVLVDLEQAPGVVSIGGDDERAREVVSALAVQAATSLWSDGAKVTLVGFANGPQLGAIAPRAIATTSTLGEALTATENERRQLLQIQRELGIDGVLKGRLAQRSIDWRPRLLVLASAPTAEEAVRLHALVEQDRSNIIVLAVGDVPSARWRFAVDADASLDLGVFGTRVAAHRLSAGRTAELAGLMNRADSAKQASLADVRILTPRQLATSREPGRGPQIGVAAARVLVLGPVEVVASGPIRPEARVLATEIITAVALAPNGLHDAVLRASIWPRGVSDAVMEAALRDAQSWLGVDAGGGPRLHRSPDGTWRLSADVHCDLATLAQVLSEAQGPQELPRLGQALGLLRGEAFSRIPAGRYNWAAFGDAARDARILATTAVCRLADILLSQERFADASAALRVGLRFVPTSETLWQKLLTTPVPPDAFGARATGPAELADEMYATLQERSVWPDPQTDALVAQLVPGYQPRRRA